MTKSSFMEIPLPWFMQSLVQLNITIVRLQFKKFKILELQPINIRNNMFYIYRSLEKLSLNVDGYYLPELLLFGWLI